ncbi:hypothetical protein KDK95_29470 [Actinospica sp. MGRD01-02]|uniref:Uncharacterized protein n=1 Tax=Actinospica acidithermotolerans TaxID=2828514 RepID=A0A941EH86_9ACTN|nr:hypothetical protein [Actinospica acidithermotolerans]MBR7830467.1 hypothetical protein [Actinospica acidithermotolerans]
MAPWIWRRITSAPRRAARRAWRRTLTAARRRLHRHELARRRLAAAAIPRAGATTAAGRRGAASGVAPVSRIEPVTGLCENRQAAPDWSRSASSSGCPCAGTGRIPLKNPATGRLEGSRSCPRHGQGARGREMFSARGAVIEGGWSGLRSWAAERQARWDRITDPDAAERYNLPRKQRRAHRAVHRRRDRRLLGPITACRAPLCDHGYVDRHRADREREAWARQQFAAAAAAHAAAGRTLSPRRARKLARRLARRAERRFPHLQCGACAGLGYVPTQ